MDITNNRLVDELIDGLLSDADDLHRDLAKAVVCELLEDEDAPALTADDEDAVVAELSALGQTGGLPQIVAALVRGLAGSHLEAALTHPLIGAGTGIGDSITAHVAERASDVVGQSVLALLDVFRTRNVIDSGRVGLAPFISWLGGTEGARELLERSPRALAMCKQVCVSRLDGILEMLDRLAADLGVLGRIEPGFDTAALLTEVEFGGGDVQGGGRATAVVRFSDGSKFVYRPRSMRPETSFAHLLEWVGDNLGVGLPTLTALDRGAYGYSEFIERVCSPMTAEGARDSLISLGKLVGILHALRSSNMHFDNVLLGADGPVVVDAQTVLTPVPRGHAAGAGRPDSIVPETLDGSILGVGLLPELVSDDADSLYMRTAPTPATAPHQVADSVFSALSGVKQREALRVGFLIAVHAVAASGEEFADVVRRLFNGVELRYIPVGAVAYRGLLTLSHHPDAIENRVVHAAVLSGVLLAENHPFPGRLLLAEARQLANGDVPRFTLEASGTRLLTIPSPGSPQFDRSPLEHAMEAIVNLGPHLGFDLHCIDLAYVQLLDPADDATGISPVAAPGDPRRINPVVREILDTAVQTIIDSPGELFAPTWVDSGVTAPGKSRWLPARAGYDLYGGSPGIALALSAGARVLNDERYAAAALRVLRPIADRFATIAGDEFSYSVGGHTGVGSTMFALSQAAGLLGEHLLPIDRDGMLRVLRAGANDELQTWDIVDGTAGALAAAISLSNGSPQHVDIVGEIAEELVRRVRGTAWGHEHTGYAHGVAGVGSVLVRAGTTVDDDSIRNQGYALFDQLRSARRSWSWQWHLTSAGTDESTKWCDGTTGMLLAFTEARAIDPGSVGLDELVELAGLVLQGGLGSDPTLCHGDAGVLDVLVDLAVVEPGLHLAGEPIEMIINRLACQVAESSLRIRRERRNRYAFVSSLMVGTAGTAWSLLRAQSASTLPSVLGLRGPLATESTSSGRSERSGHYMVAHR